MPQGENLLEIMPSVVAVMCSCPFSSIGTLNTCLLGLHYFVFHIAPHPQGMASVLIPQLLFLSPMFNLQVANGPLFLDFCKSCGFGELKPTITERQFENDLKLVSRIAEHYELRLLRDISLLAMAADV